VIIATQRARCDKCPFESEPFPDRTTLYRYMRDPKSLDGEWYMYRGRHICRGCIIARACRIFGHVPDEGNDYWCSRCKERIGPSSTEFNRYERCHFCGTYVMDDREYDGAPHATKDCRPDLFEHEVGSTCTWGPDRGCYWDHDNHELTRLGAWWNGVTT